jgi:hypothetical protein
MLPAVSDSEAVRVEIISTEIENKGIRNVS